MVTFCAGWERRSPFYKNTTGTLRDVVRIEKAGIWVLMERRFHLPHRSCRPHQLRLWLPLVSTSRWRRRSLHDVLGARRVLYHHVFDCLGNCGLVDGNVFYPSPVSCPHFDDQTPPFHSLGRRAHLWSDLSFNIVEQFHRDRDLAVILLRDDWYLALKAWWEY